MLSSHFTALLANNLCYHSSQEPPEHVDCPLEFDVGCKQLTATLMSVLCNDLKHKGLVICVIARSVPVIFLVPQNDDLPLNRCGCMTPEYLMTAGTAYKL